MDNDEINNNFKTLFENSKVIIEIKDKGVLLANATFVLGDTELRGWRIQKSKFGDDLWIQAPNHGISQTNKPLFTFWTEDKELNDIVKCLIIEAYEDERIRQDAGKMAF